MVESMSNLEVLSKALEQLTSLRRLIPGNKHVCGSGRFHTGTHCLEANTPGR
jgi:hypothetical protein